MSKTLCHTICISTNHISTLTFTSLNSNAGGKVKYELAIVGAGPAGFTAAIYAKRAGINAVAFDMSIGGGLALESPEIENYPGFPSIRGIELVDKMREHAQKYSEIRFMEEVTNLEIVGESIKVTTTLGTYTVGAVILATGEEHRKLDVKGEREFLGKGVSYCATCDGFFFKGKRVAVIGGGNTSLCESLYLKGLNIDVTIVHRRDRFRAEAGIVERALDSGIKVVRDSVVEEIYGDETVRGVRLRNLKTGESLDLGVDGVFITIGEVPRTKLAKDLGVELDEKGYIKTDRQCRTNIPRVYAAGDVTGGVRQIITACAEGAVAALSACEVLGKQYPY